MTAYADISDLAAFYPGNDIPTEEAAPRLNAASVEIDSMTYRRIAVIGFDNLTDFQKEIVRRAVCAQAVFCYDNSDMLNSAIASYSINGVSVSYDQQRVMLFNGILTSPEIHGILSQSGLCVRRV